MANYLDMFVQQLFATSNMEWIAVVFAMIYLLLAVKENSWCWPAAFISTAIYTVLFFDVNLYMESLLNIYYLAMAVYGWYQWFGHKWFNKTDGEAVKPIVVWSFKTNLMWIIGVSSIVLLSGYLLEKFTNQDFAYIDSFTTWFAVITTYMVAKKVLQNWIYWIVIDSVSIYLYLQKGFILTSLLFVCYVVIAVFGWFKWKQHYLKQNTH